MTEQIGNDGLTDAERAECARRFRETAGAPLTRKEGCALRAWRAGKRATSDTERAQLYREATDEALARSQARRSEEGA